MMIEFGDDTLTTYYTGTKTESVSDIYKISWIFEILLPLKISGLLPSIYVAIASYSYCGDHVQLFQQLAVRSYPFYEHMYACA